MTKPEEDLYNLYMFIHDRYGVTMDEGLMQNKDWRK